MDTSDKQNNAAVIAYITLIGTVIAIFMNQEENKTEFASFHIRQALGIFISFFYWAILLDMLIAGQPLRLSIFFILSFGYMAF